MNSVLPISTLILLSLSHILLGSVLPEPEEQQHRLEKRDVSEISGIYNESLVHSHTDEEKQDILALHNEFRSSVSPSASNMEYMVCQSFVVVMYSCCWDKNRNISCWASVQNSKFLYNFIKNIKNL